MVQGVLSNSIHVSQMISEENESENTFPPSQSWFSLTIFVCKDIPSWNPSDFLMIGVQIIYSLISHCSILHNKVKTFPFQITWENIPYYFALNIRVTVISNYRKITLCKPTLYCAYTYIRTNIIMFVNNINLI